MKFDDLFPYLLAIAVIAMTLNFMAQFEAPTHAERILSRDAGTLWSIAPKVRD